jgi:hypothetical protein
MSHITMIVLLKIPQRGGEIHGLRLINAWVHHRHVADNRARGHMREHVSTSIIGDAEIQPSPRSRVARPQCLDDDRPKSTPRSPLRQACSRLRCLPGRPLWGRWCPARAVGCRSA